MCTVLDEVFIRKEGVYCIFGGLGCLGMFRWRVSRSGEESGCLCGMSWSKLVRREGGLGNFGFVFGGLRRTVLLD